MQRGPLKKSVMGVQKADEALQKPAEGPDALRKPFLAIENSKRPSECVGRSFQKRRQIVRKHEQMAKTALERTIDFCWGEKFGDKICGTNWQPSKSHITRTGAFPPKGRVTSLPTIRAPERIAMHCGVFFNRRGYCSPIFCRVTSWQVARCRWLKE